jgi:hypothetical protein
VTMKNENESYYEVSQRIRGDWVWYANYRTRREANEAKEWLSMSGVAAKVTRVTPLFGVERPLVRPMRRR